MEVGMTECPALREKAKREGKIAESENGNDKETKGSWERGISGRDQRAEIEKPETRKMERNGKEECDGSSEVNLINGKVKNCD